MLPKADMCDYFVFKMTTEAMICFPNIVMT